jgi:hypothetical protein
VGGSGNEGWGAGQKAGRESGQVMLHLPAAHVIKHKNMAQCNTYTEQPLMPCTLRHLLCCVLAALSHLCAAAVLVRVSVETTNVASSTGLCMLKRSARPDHRKEAGADTQGLMAGE